MKKQLNYSIIPTMSDTFSKIKRATLLQISPNLCRPKAARLIITINCNFRCQMCTFWGERHEDPSLETVKYWIRELADFGIEEVDIGGGEPFVRSDLKEIVEEIKRNGMRAAITTNGWLVTEESFPDVDFCEVSVDGAKPETHDKIRGMKGAWERAIRAAQIAQKRCQTHLNFTLQSDNYRELPDFCEMAKRLGFPVSIIPVSLKLAAQPKISDKLSEYDIPLLKEKIEKALATGAMLDNLEFINIFLRKLEKGPISQKCMAPSRCILIFYNGDIYPCGNFDQVVGNLKEGKKLKDVYRDYAKIRNEIWAGKHPFCAQCVYPDIANRQTIWSAAKSYLKDRLNKK